MIRRLGILAAGAAIWLALGSVAFAGWGTGLTVVLHNCQNPKIPLDAQLSACSQLIHSNLGSRRMKAAFYALRAQAYQRANKTDLAMQDYNRALEKFPDFTQALDSRGNLYEGLGKNDLAMADYTHAIEVTSKEVYALRDRCRLRRNLDKDLQGALEDCDAAVKLAPDNGEGLMLRGMVNARLGHCAASQADFDAAVKADPTITIDQPSRACTQAAAPAAGGH